MSKATDYTLPNGIVGLKGAVSKPAPGTLPLRGDLAHIALAERYLAAHYVIPTLREVGGEGATMRLAARADADVVIELEPGTQIEALDYAGPWCWACLGPEGPSGYVDVAQLAPEVAQ